MRPHRLRKGKYWSGLPGIALMFRADGSGRTHEAHVAFPDESNNLMGPRSHLRLQWGRQDFILKLPEVARIKLAQWLLRSCAVNAFAPGLVADVERIANARDLVNDRQ